MLNKSEHTMVAKYPAPDTAEGTADTIKALLSHDDVKHLEYLPEDGIIRVVHYVNPDDLGPVEDEVGWDAALQNVEVFEEYESPGAESFQVVYDMMHLVAHHRCNPTQWVVGVDGVVLIDEWLELKERGMPGGNGQLMGVPLVELKTLPQETLILCGSKYSGARPEEISFAVKTAVEIRRSHEHGNLEDGEAAYRSGNGAAERSASTGALETTAGELRIPRWKG